LTVSARRQGAGEWGLAVLAYAGFVWEVTCGGASLLPDSAA